MIEICLNPDNDTIGGETFESVDSEVNQSGARDTLDMAIRTADKLLKVNCFEGDDYSFLFETLFLRYLLRIATCLSQQIFMFQELSPKPGDQQVSHQILSNFLLLATKQKANAERALQDFMNIASQESYKNHVGAILGMATAYMILKQVR